jgi:hypothetical protein
MQLIGMRKIAQVHKPLAYSVNLRGMAAARESLWLSD